MGGGGSKEQKQALKDAGKTAKKKKAADLSNLGFEEIPGKVFSYKALVTLNLTNNNIAEVPAKVKKLTALRNLNLSKNALVALPPELKLCPLEHLYLADNKFGEYPAILAEMEGIKGFSYAGNKLGDVSRDVIHTIRGAVQVSLARNQLHEVPNSIGTCIKMTDLDLSGNAILAELPSSIANLPNLKTLNLKDCGFVSLPTVLGECPSLTKLNVNNNHLEDLPDSLVAIKDANPSFAIDYKRNPMTGLPKSLRDGTQGDRVFDYLRNRDAWSEPSEESSENGEAGAGVGGDANDAGSGVGGSARATATTTGNTAPATAPGATDKDNNNGDSSSGSSSSSSGSSDSDDDPAPAVLAPPTTTATADNAAAGAGDWNSPPPKPQSSPLRSSATRSVYPTTFATTAPSSSSPRASTTSRRSPSPRRPRNDYSYGITTSPGPVRRSLSPPRRRGGRGTYSSLGAGASSRHSPRRGLDTGILTTSPRASSPRRRARSPSPQRGSRTSTSALFPPLRRMSPPSRHATSTRAYAPRRSATSSRRPFSAGAGGGLSSSTTYRARSPPRFGSSRAGRSRSPVRASTSRADYTRKSNLSMLAVSPSRRRNKSPSSRLPYGEPSRKYTSRVGAFNVGMSSPPRRSTNASSTNGGFMSSLPRVSHGVGANGMPAGHRSPVPRREFGRSLSRSMNQISRGRSRSPPPRMSPTRSRQLSPSRHRGTGGGGTRPSLTMDTSRGSTRVYMTPFV